MQRSVDDYNPGNNGYQKVRLKPLPNGKYKFYFAHDSLRWEIPGGQLASYTPLQQAPDSSNAWQQFNLERQSILIPLPVAPVGVGTRMVDGNVTLSWGAAAYANGYNVKRSTASGGPYTTVASGVAATTYVDAVSTPTASYYYVVSAVSDAGEGANSTQVMAQDYYQQWAQQDGLIFGAPGSGFSDVGSLGMVNGVRYAVPLGLKVTAGTSTSSPTVAFDLRNDPNVKAALWTSSDLTTWTLSDMYFTVPSDQGDVAFGFKRFLYQNSSNGSQSSQQFYRLQLAR